MIDKQSMPLDSERLRFRRLVYEDHAELAVMLQDPKVMYAWEHTFTDQQVREWIDRQLDDYRNDGIGYFAAIEKSTGELVGQIGAHWSDYKGRRVLEVCYMLKHAFTGRGYALEGAKAMIEHAGTKLYVPEIYAFIRSGNAPSILVAERAGMIPAGSFVKHYNGIDMEHLVFVHKSKARP